MWWCCYARFVGTLLSTRENEDSSHASVGDGLGRPSQPHTKTLFIDIKFTGMAFRVAAEKQPKHVWETGKQKF